MWVWSGSRFAFKYIFSTPNLAPAELEELGLDPHYVIDTFSSDYDEFIDDMGEC